MAEKPPRFSGRIKRAVEKSPPEPSKARSIRRVGSLTMDTEFTKTVAEWREGEHRYATAQVFRYRAAEFDIKQAPQTHYNSAAFNAQPLKQHSEPRGGIHSCVNTSQLNAMLWQGQISQATAERINGSLVKELRQYFGEEHQSSALGASYKPGYPKLAEHFNEVVPTADFSYFDAQFGTLDMHQIIVSELLRGSVIVGDKPDHSVTIVGYSDLDHSNYGATNMLVCDPLNPHSIFRHQLQTFQKTSMIIPSLQDPIRNLIPELT